MNCTETLRRMKSPKTELACAAAGQQTLEPGTEQPLKRGVHQHEKDKDHKNGRQQGGVRDAGADCDRQQPANGSDGGKIGQAVGEAHEIERGKAQRETQERAKFEGRAESSHEKRENLPEKKNAPEEQAAAIRNGR